MGYYLRLERPNPCSPALFLEWPHRRLSNLNAVEGD
jgi:hypothetical protein